jgi:hypothetical protein
VKYQKNILNNKLKDLKQKVNQNPTLYPPLQIYAALEEYYEDFIGRISLYKNIHLLGEYFFALM